ncbi:hypothetical protein HHK36_021663 [Tetracentron sinense]|uniref:Phytocyanin domain-containing protein n=1 Tax=Tetracentron sinense TaxID=13715 RepID=A0A834YQ59_TETSI|nr:hypothetical protein HHK36_021663 [Tetracentron sinense]
MKNSMASLLGLFCAFLVLATVNTDAGASNEFKVGNIGVWRQPDANDTAMYNQWAANNRFRVGDSLYFEYKEDSVLVVDKRGYHHCNATNPISAFNNGKTVIKLDKPGLFYFISGTPDHCRNGQRLVVNVLVLHPSTPQPPLSIAIPPQPYPTDSPSPSPLPSSGASVAATMVIVSMVLTTNLVTLVYGAP